MTILILIRLEFSVGSRNINKSSLSSSLIQTPVPEKNSYSCFLHSVNVILDLLLWLSLQLFILCNSEKQTWDFEFKDSWVAFFNFGISLEAFFSMIFKISLTFCSLRLETFSIWFF